MSEKLFGAIASALHLDAAEFTTALKDGEKWLADDDLAAKVAEEITKQVKAAKDAQHKRGQREAWSAVEKVLKTKGFSNEEKAQGTALLDVFFEQYSPETTPEGKKPTEFSEDELAKLPTVKALMQKAKAEAGKQYEQLKSEYDQARQKWQTERVTEVAKRKLSEHLEEAKVMLEVPGSNVSKAKRVEAIAAMLDFSSISLNDKGEVIFVDAEGNPKTDDFGKALDFKKHVVAIGSDLYGIQKQDPTKGGGNPAGGGAKGAAGADYTPKFSFANSSEYDTALKSASTPEDRLEVMKSWRHQQQQAAAGK